MSRKKRKLAAAARKNDVACSGPDSYSIPSGHPSSEEMARHELRQTYYEKFQPTDGVERDLVDEMISAQWRQRCLTLIEDVAFAQIMSAAAAPDIAVAFEEKSKTLILLGRSRKGYAHQFNQALSALLKLRASIAPPNEEPIHDQPLPPAPVMKQPDAGAAGTPDLCFPPQTLSTEGQTYHRPALE